jgi:hypothetical protein
MGCSRERRASIRGEAKVEGTEAIGLKPAGSRASSPGEWPAGHDYQNSFLKVVWMSRDYQNSFLKAVWMSRDYPKTLLEALSE